MIELVLMASVASSLGEPLLPLPIDSVVLIASVPPSSPSISSSPPVRTPAPASGSGSQPVYFSSPQQQTLPFQPQQQQPKQSWAEKMWKRYMQNKGGQ